MSRRYAPSEVYDERDREYYRKGPRSEREYDELDVEISRERVTAAAPPPAASVADYHDSRRRQPEFLRDDYGRTNAGPLVVRERGHDEYDRASVAPSASRRVERDELVIREREREQLRRPAPPPASRRRSYEFERDEVVYRREGHEERPPRPARARSRQREEEREEISFRRTEVDRRAHSRGRGPEQEEEEEEFTYRRNEQDRTGRGRSAPHRPRELVAREKEEFVIRRRETSRPAPAPAPPPPEIEKEQIIIRRRERSVSSSPSPSPPPPLEPIVRPPILQEVITHHRHIDHGVERARSLSPPSPPPSAREDDIEIEIKRRVVEEDIIIESDVRERKNKQRHGGPRRRSLSVPRRTPHAPHESYDTTEIDYSRRRETGRGRDKSSQEWAIVDVPDASRGGQRDVGGGGGVSSHEISLQRTNGVRRSKITIDKEEYMAGPSASQPRKTKEREMWTEITKDLVVKQAIETMGYDYEETEYFFYVMDYLRYEDVLRLVQLSDDIRRDRRERMRDIKYEREEVERRERAGRYDDRVVEREVIYESGRTGRHR